MTDPGELARGILDAALAAADAGRAVGRSVSVEGDLLRAGPASFRLGRESVVRVAGAGKAAARMLAGLAAVPGLRIAEGILVTKDGHLGRATLPGAVEIAEASHPVPDERCVEASRRIAQIASRCGSDDLLICLFSGGGSSLMSLPPPGLSLEDVRSVTRSLLVSGATVRELNTVRKHLCELKGGRLAALAAPATVISLLVSDVVGDPPDTIASGPTAPDPTTFADALAVLGCRLPSGAAPPAVLRHLRAGAAGKVAETPKPGDPVFGRVHNAVVAGNRLSAEAAVERAAASGLNAVLVTTAMEGEAREVGSMIAGMIRSVDRLGRPVGRPACLVFAGETTVTVRGGGTGGRNQELALSAAIGMRGIGGACVAAFSTDGQDGPTLAAGAIATGETAARAAALGMDPLAYLDDNDSNTFFSRLEDLMRTGPTLTNVADLVVALIL